MYDARKMYDANKEYAKLADSFWIMQEVIEREERPFRLVIKYPIFDEYWKAVDTETEEDKYYDSDEVLTRMLRASGIIKLYSATGKLIIEYRKGIWKE